MLAGEIKQSSIVSQMPMLRSFIHWNTELAREVGLPTNCKMKLFYQLCKYDNNLESIIIAHGESVRLHELTGSL